MEQTRLKTKELGNQKKWLDWVAKYADRVIGLNELKENDRQEYLEGVLDRIEVRLNTETNEYADPKIKSKGYTVVEGDTDAELVLPYAQTQQMHKDARTSGRWDKEVKKKTK